MNRGEQATQQMLLPKSQQTIEAKCFHPSGMMHIRTRRGVHIALEDLFAAATVADMAVAVLSTLATQLEPNQW